MREQHRSQMGSRPDRRQRMNTRLALPRLRNVPAFNPSRPDREILGSLDLAMPMVAVDAANCLSGNDVRTALQPWYPVAALTDPSRAGRHCGVSPAEQVPPEVCAVAEP
jgi:hypothetical protein